MQEGRTFPPPAEFAAQANIKDESVYAWGDTDPVGYWAAQAQRLDWFRPWDKVLEWNEPFARWFVGGQLNAAYNCVDRHVQAGRGDRVAYYWEGEPGETRTLTYAGLLDEVSRCANALKSLGVKRGDRVALYMPMIPELPIAMLACARIGAPHTVVFGGFSSEALAGRIDDSQAKLLITADGGWRRGKPANLKNAADEAVAATKTIEHVLVVRRLGDKAEVEMTKGRDVWWHDIVDRQSSDCPPVPVDSEHMLYLLYTSGSTAKPKGIFHTSAGYLLGTSYTHEMIFDPKPNDVYWCAADIGWVTGHSYIVYGPPVVDTWWQTETGMILITPLPGVPTTKPGSATFPFPGVQADVVDGDGRSVPLGGGGYLVLKRPWPAMLRGIYGDPKRYKETYWSRFPGMYFAGDGAKRDEDGYFWLLGRVDDVMNVAGHRISTIEVESALVDHKKVAEAAVVGKNDPVTGQAIFAFVILRAGV